MINIAISRNYQEKRISKAQVQRQNNRILNNYRILHHNRNLQHNSIINHHKIIIHHNNIIITRCFHLIFNKILVYGNSILVFHHQQYTSNSNQTINHINKIKIINIILLHKCANIRTLCFLIRKAFFAFSNSFQCSKFITSEI